MEGIKIQKEADETAEEIKALQLLLTDKTIFNSAIENEINRISKKYGDEHRTINITLEKEKETTEPIEEKNLIVYFTNFGNVYVDEVTTLLAQRRGGRGAKIKLKKDEVLVKSISCKSNQPILLFSNKGNVFKIELEELLHNENIYSLINLENEKIISISAYNKNKFIVFATKNGMIKKSSFDEYHIKKGRSIIGLKLAEGDQLVKVVFLDDEDIGILTSQGYFKIISTKDINPIGRVTQGVIGIKLNNEDHVVDINVLNKKHNGIISISDKGYIARVDLSDNFSISGRSAKGKVVQTGCLIGFIFVSNEDKNIIIAAEQNTIKIPTQDITITNTKVIGKKAINLLPNNNIIGVMNEL
jgi:DNA gyrase subunit A